MLATGEFQTRAAELGILLRERLEAMIGHGVVGVRVRGLWAGVDIDPAIGTGREVCEALMARGVLAKDTHGSTIRLAPPLVISAEDLRLGSRPAGRRRQPLDADPSNCDGSALRESTQRATSAGQRVGEQVVELLAGDAGGVLGPGQHQRLGHRRPAADDQPGDRGVGEQLVAGRPR